MQSVDRIHISQIEPREFAAKYRSGEGRPALIAGAFDGLPPCTFDWLIAKLPNEKLPARFYGKDHFKKPKTEWKKYSETMELTPSEYAVMLSERRAHTDNVYMAQVPIGETELGRILRPFMRELGDRTGLKAVIDLNIWWGPGGHTEPLHYDSGDGTLIQLHGVKRAALFPPSQTRNLYPFPFRTNGIVPWISQVYIDRPDFDSFPRLKEALPHRLDVTLAPGELLFIPANWWHEVTAMSEDYICSINRFWKVAPLTRLFANNVSPIVYPLSMMMLAHMRRKARKAGKEVYV